MIADIAGWVALGATCTAAILTASNLGARLTGLGFVLFAIGALAWAIDGYSTGQSKLLWSNGYLAIVDVFGVWRWLGWRARLDDASRAEEARSGRQRDDDLFSATRLDGMPIRNSDGDIIGHVTDALISVGDGGISYLIIREGGTAGLGENLRRLPWSSVQVSGQEGVTRLSRHELQELTLTDPE